MHVPAAAAVTGIPWAPGPDDLDRDPRGQQGRDGIQPAPEYERDLPEQGIVQRPAANSEDGARMTTGAEPVKQRREQQRVPGSRVQPGRSRKYSGRQECRPRRPARRCG
jgi:hypothetical protein